MMESLYAMPVKNVISVQLVSNEMEKNPMGGGSLIRPPGTICHKYYRH